MFPHDDYVIEPMPSNVKLHHHRHHHQNKQRHPHSNKHHHDNNQHSNQHRHDNPDHHGNITNNTNSSDSDKYTNTTTTESGVKSSNSEHGFHSNQSLRNRKTKSELVNTDENSSSAHVSNSDKFDLKRHQHLGHDPSDDLERKSEDQGQRHILYKRSAVQEHQGNNYEQAKGNCTYFN